MPTLDKHFRVLQIITLFSVGGATETVISLARGLKEKGYEVTVVSGPHIESEGDMMPIAHDAGIQVRIVPHLQRDIHPINDIRSLFSLMKIIKDGNYDIVHTHSSKAGILGRLAALFVGEKNIVHTIHGLPFHDYQSSFIRHIFISVEKFVAHFTTYLIAVSEKIVLDSLKYHIGKKEQFKIVRSGFHTNLYMEEQNNRKLRQKLSLDDNDFILGKISRLSSLKGHSALLRVMPSVKKEFPNIKLLFVGDGEIRNELENDVLLNDLQDVVIFIGAVRPAEIPSYLSLMDVVIHTSLHEGLPRVIPQALVMGKPVISYNLDGAPEVIQNKFNGLLIAPSNDNELLDAIRKIVEQYEYFRQNCLIGREKIRQEFDDGKMVQDICDLYCKILG
jgi:glycosyltransferase involved in cell wall biosynthesis